MTQKGKGNSDTWTRALIEGRLSRRSWLSGMLRAGVSLPAIAATLAETGVAIGTADGARPLRIFNVPKFTGFVYFELAKAGGAKACAELGAQQIYIGTTTADVEGQVQVLQNILPQRPDGIVIASLDLNAPVPVLRRARSQGTIVVTFDADVAPAGRDLFVNMAPFEIQAKAMLESALANAPAGGQSIWIAPTPTVANFISQKRALDQLVATVPRYQSIHFIDTLYANDDPEKSYAVGSSAMQAHPELKLFISGSGISNPAINKAIQDTGRTGKIFSTGFALPSTMTTFLENGTCRQFALWSPYKYGYMATYCAILLKSGKLATKPGTKLEVPTIGEREIGSGATTDLDQMVFFTKGHEDFNDAIPMKS
jgi:rhamnose transport system substrate-binding protein